MKCKWCGEKAGHFAACEYWKLSQNAFTVKDSGKRQQFDSGMVRDTQEGKIDYTVVLDGPMLDRWAAHLTKAKEKYPDVRPGVANWTLAEGEEELQRFKKSAFRHFRQWLRGDQDEDHAASVIFNMNGYEFVLSKIKAKHGIPT
jgi:hypothetical protein